MKKVVLWTSISVFFIVLLKTAIFSHISFFTVLPDFVLLIVIYISISNGSIIGLTSGFIAGFLLDFLSVAPIGLHSFLFTLLGYVVGKFYGIYNLNKVIFPCILGCSGFLFQALFLFILKLIFGHNVHTYNIFSFKFLIEMAVNIVFAPLVFMFFNMFPQAFKLQEYNKI